MMVERVCRGTANPSYGRRWPASVGAPERLGVRARRADLGGRPCGATPLRCSTWGRAVHLAPCASRTAHDAGGSVLEARCARRPQACAPRRLPRPAAPAPQAALLTRGGGREVATTVPAKAWAGRRPRAWEAPGLAVAGSGVHAVRASTTDSPASCAARSAELSGRRAPGDSQAREVGPQGRPPRSRAAAGLPTPLLAPTSHVPTGHWNAASRASTCAKGH
jgi:hypothetical protein